MIGNFIMQYRDIKYRDIHSTKLYIVDMLYSRHLFIVDTFSGTCRIITTLLKSYFRIKKGVNALSANRKKWSNTH